MERRHITMTYKKLSRIEVFSKLQERALIQVQSADLLGISVRHIKGYVKAYGAKEGR